MLEQRPLTKPIVCIECNRRWADPTERWRIYVSRDDPPQAVPYCPECARREFDLGLNVRPPHFD